jgi:DNA adenine methylase
MFKALQEGWIPPKELTKEEYDYIKNNPDEKPYLTGFVGFGCSFAGKWFGGYAKDNTNRNYCLNAHNSILEKMKNLMNTTFECKDYKELNPENCLIYCDPPYKGTTPYYKKILGEFPYDIFLDWIHKQSKNNLVLVSEYKHNVPDDAIIVLEIPSKTSIRDKSGQVIETVEVLYTLKSL